MNEKGIEYLIQKICDLNYQVAFLISLNEELNLKIKNLEKENDNVSSEVE